MRPVPPIASRAAAGFTLVEIIITTGLLAMIAGLLIGIGSDAMRGVNKARQSANTWEDLRALSTQLERDLASLAQPPGQTTGEPFTLARTNGGMALTLWINVPADRVKVQAAAGPQEVEYTWDRELGQILRIAKGSATDPERDDGIAEEAADSASGQGQQQTEAGRYRGEVLARQVTACVIERVERTNDETTGTVGSGTTGGSTADGIDWPAAFRLTLTTLAVPATLEATQAPRRISELIIPFPQAYVE